MFKSCLHSKILVCPEAVPVLPIDTISLMHRVPSIELCDQIRYAQLTIPETLWFWWLNWSFWLFLFWRAGDSAETCDSKETGDFDDSGKSGDYGESDDSRVFGDYGEFGDSGKYSDYGETGVVLILVNWDF